MHSDASNIEKNWHERGFSCNLWVDPPGTVWEDYVHPVDELIMVLEGELELEMQGGLFRLEPGKEIFIPARTRRSVRNIGHETVRWLYGFKGG